MTSESRSQQKGRVRCVFHDTHSNRCLRVVTKAIDGGVRMGSFMASRSATRPRDQTTGPWLGIWRPPVCSLWSDSWTSLSIRSRSEALKKKRRKRSTHLRLFPPSLQAANSSSSVRHRDEDEEREKPSVPPRVALLASY